eukprot:9092090-Alexandrium_andersonii.AAC.1
MFGRRDASRSAKQAAVPYACRRSRCKRRAAVWFAGTCSTMATGPGAWPEARLGSMSTRPRVHAAVVSATRLPSVSAGA